MTRPTVEELETPAIRQAWLQYQIEQIIWAQKFRAAKRRIAGAYPEDEESWPTSS